MPLSLRSATLEDAVAMASLAGELAYPTSPEVMRERLELLLQSSKDTVLVAQDDRLVGWLHAGLRLSVEAGVQAEILGLVVTASRRGLGIGSRLVEAAEHWAVQNGYAQLRVRSNAVRERTHAFYHRLGYKETKQQRVFVKRLDPDS